MSKITPSRRARASIAALMSTAMMIGGIWYVDGSSGKVPAAIVLASETLVQPWEGRELKAYRDIVGVWTICDGDTENVKSGMVETPAGCDARLEKRLTRDFYPKLLSCIANFAKKPISWQAMMISLSYNIGSSAACNSTAARLGRYGDYLNSCLAATRFNKAGGKMIIGLVKRREMGDTSRIGEAELCVSGLN